MKSYKIYVKLKLNGFYQLSGEAYNIKLNLLPIFLFNEINDLLFNSTSDAN